MTTPIEVLALAEDGSPGTLVYHFAKPLEDTSLRWVRWHDGRYVSFDPPGVGGPISLPPAIGPLAGFGW